MRNAHGQRGALLRDLLPFAHQQSGALGPVNKALGSPEREAVLRRLVRRAVIMPRAARCRDRTNLLHEGHHVNHGLSLGDLPAHDPMNVQCSDFHSLSAGRDAPQFALMGAMERQRSDDAVPFDNL